MGSPPHVLVTGASTGIGAACVERLLADGWVVHGTVRRDEDAARLRAAGAVAHLADVTDQPAMDAATDAVLAAAGDRLRGVVANAGVAVGGPLEAVTADELAHQLDVNVVGVHRSVVPLLARLRATGGRVVLVSSVSGRVASPFLGPYAASKFALEAWGDALRRELGPLGVHVALVEPGPVATPIWDRSLPDDDAVDRVPAAYRERTAAFTGALQRDGAAGIPARDVAEVVHHALAARRPRTRYALPRDVAVVGALVPRLPTRLADALVRLAGPG